VAWNVPLIGDPLNLPLTKAVDLGYHPSCLVGWQVKEQ
jgi:hypothetical protein